jgi:hypothetical protein
MSNAEAAPDDPAVLEDLLQPGGACIRADVEILRPLLEEEVAYTAADEISQVAKRGQPVKDPQRVLVDVLPGDGMLGSREDQGLFREGIRSVCGS